MHKLFYGGPGWTRTSEGECQQIYSLPRLTASVPTLAILRILQYYCSALEMEPSIGLEPMTDGLQNHCSTN